VIFREDKKIYAYSGVFITTVMWATSGVFIKLILLSSRVSELSLAFWRDLCTFSILFLALLIFRRDLLKSRAGDIVW
jgi:drug/metabolite transporter (DMT)-like permease